MKTDLKPDNLDNWAKLGKYIFIQACKDMMGMDNVPQSIREEAERWLASPNADLYAGQVGAGASAIRSIKEDPQAARHRFLSELNALRSLDNH